MRRELQPSVKGTFTSSFVADDDYQLFVCTSACDSGARLLQVR